MRLRSLSYVVFTAVVAPSIAGAQTQPASNTLTSRIDHVLEASRVSLTTARLADYVGAYVSEELEVRLDVAIKDDHLVLRRRPADEMTMRPIYDDNFATPIGANSERR